MIYLTTLEVASALQVPETRIRRLCREGAMPGAIRIGKSWRIAADFADQIAERQAS